MPRIPVILLLVILPISGCTDFHELDGQISAQARAADFPSLLPLDQILSGAQDVQITPETTAGLSARLARLRARAARLRGPVLSRSDRQQLRAAVQRHQ